MQALQRSEEVVTGAGFRWVPEQEKWEALGRFRGATGSPLAEEKKSEIEGKLEVLAEENRALRAELLRSQQTILELQARLASVDN